MNSNQPDCPQRLTSYDKAQDHKISNQYMNNGHTFYQSYNQNMSLQNPNNVGSVYSINQNSNISLNPSINSNNSGSVYRVNQNPSINSNNSGSMYKVNQNPSINSNNSGSMYRINQNPSINQNQNMNQNINQNQNINNYYPPKPVSSYQPQGSRLNSGDPSFPQMNNYNQQVNNYNQQQMNNYGQQMNNQNQQMNNYGQQMNNQNQQMNNYGQQMNNQNQQMNNYGQQINNQDQQANNYGQQMNNQDQQTNNYGKQINNQDQQMNNQVQSVPSLDTNNNSDFEINFTEPEKPEKLKFFDIIPNIKEISKQNKLSKWTLVFIVFQVISMVVLETLLSLNYHYFYNNKLKEINENYDYQCTNEKIDDCETIVGYKDFKKNVKQINCLHLYQLIFIAAQFFVLIMYYDSFRISSSIQLIAISIFNILVAGYSGFQIHQTFNLIKKFERIKNLENKTINNDEKIKMIAFTNFEKIETMDLKDNDSKYDCIIGYEIANVIIMFVSAVGLLIMSLFLFKKLGWNIYRNLGADIKKTVILKRRYNFGIVLKIKYFFLFGIIIQCLVFNNALDKTEKINFSKDFKDIMNSINIIVKNYAAVALSIIFIINILCGYISVKKEKKFLMVLHIITDMVFILFSIYMISIINYDSWYETVKNSLTGFASVEILILFVSIYYSMEVLSDFHILKLKEKKDNDLSGRRLSL